VSNLYAVLRRAVTANARRVVDLCVDELPAHATLTAARQLEFAVFMRERTLDLVTNDHPFTADDLAVVAAIGEERGRTGVSRETARRLVSLHAAASVREIHEAAGAADLDDTLHLLGWLGEHGAVAQREYNLGFLRGEQHHLPGVGQVRTFAAMADVFLEIGVAELPEIDLWLRDVLGQLAAGAELVGTLDAFYRNDLDRARAAASLNVHPRTLDYRLRRVRELTGIDPRSTNGILVFTTALARADG
jgi:PucR C-terminal helix-turn-helix domain